MKVLKTVPENCIACHACESTCSKTWFKQDNVKKSSIAIEAKNPISNGLVMTTCTQCGECIDVCPIQAISRDNQGVVRINKKICVGCFICVGFCPENAMMMHDDYIEPFKCIACGQCVKSCPTQALVISEQ